MDIYLVGGAVRDQLLGLAVKDKDWVVVGTTPEAMSALGYRQVGADFPVFLHPDTQEEYALARTERKRGRGYQGFECQFSDSVSLEQDLLRRDLTINAMALTDSGDLIDPYQGQQDLKDKILRHVSPAFIEDPLRVLRVARFAARYHHLGFRIADETQQLMKQVVAEGEIDHLVAERVYQESHRAIAEPSPHIYFAELYHCQALQHWFPEWLHFAPSFDCPTQSSEANNRWAAYSSYLSDHQIQSLAERIKLPNAIRDLAKCASTIADKSSWLMQPTVAQILVLIDDCDGWRRPDRLVAALTVVLERVNSHYSISDWQNWLQQLKSISARQLVDQGFRGAEIGQQLDKLRQEKLAQLLADT